MNVQDRLQWLTPLACVVIFSLGGVGLYHLNSLSAGVGGNLQTLQHETAALIAAENAHSHFKTQVQEWKNLLLRGGESKNFDSHTQRFAEEELHTQSCLKLVQELLVKLQQPAGDVESLLKTHMELGNRYRHTALTLFNQADATPALTVEQVNPVFTVDQLAHDAERPVDEALDKLSLRLEQLARQRIDDSQQYNAASLSNSRSYVIGVALLGLLVTGVFSLSSSRELMRQLGGDPAKAAAAARKIAAGNLTFDITPESDNHDSLMHALQDMQSQLRGMISNVVSSADEVAHAAEQLAYTSNQVSGSSMEQQQSADAMASAMQDMSARIEHIAHNADDAHQRAHKAAAYSDESAAIVNQAVHEIVKIAEVVNRSSENIKSLGAHSEKISDVIHVIKDIADQTNLLALNAAIEAARAGEQGRGFAVVADEVRNLAARTAKSTQEIAAMIETIQNGTLSAVGGMEEGSRRVNEGVSMANKAGESMLNIKEGTSNVIHSIDEISDALQQQASAAEQLTHGIEQVARTTRENSTAAGTLASSVDQLREMSRQLKRSTERFKLGY